MNYYDLVNDAVNEYVNPCDAEVGPGEYRRVIWEKYNPTGLNKNPANGEEWDTEIIPISKRVFTHNLLGQKSEIIPETPPEEGGVSPSGIYVPKIGVYFATQSEIESYVSSIGSNLIGTNDWYGADLSKLSLFKTQFEIDMYRIENMGGIWTRQGPRIDPRTMLNISYNYEISINYNGTEDHRIAYLKHYETSPCTFVGLRLNLDVDMSLPGIPVAEPPTISALPPEIISGRYARLSSVGCLPFSAKFPYNGLTNAILEAWNTSRNSFKLYWDMLPGFPSSGKGFSWSTAYNYLSIAMEELGSAALAMGQYVQQQAWMMFKAAISQALNIVGGAWDLIKSFLPKITILGVTIDIEDLCMSGNGVQSLKDMFESFNTEDVIKSIYSAIGSAYDYAVERVKAYSRDIIDAITDLYDWAWSKLLMAGVALSKFLVDIAQIWSMPPIVPNPVWAVITAVKEMMKQVKPLDMIMSGNFPGFTASDVYQLVMDEVSKLVDIAYAKIEDYKNQMLAIWEQIKAQKQYYQKQLVEFKQYLSGMYEKVTDAITEAKEAAIAESKALLDSLNDKYNQIKSLMQGERTSVSDILSMALEAFKKLPIVAQMEELLGMLGATVEDMMKIYENAVTHAKSLYHEFTDGARSIKDLIKSMYNQISTLALSKVTQWINKLLSIFGLAIIFPTISICVPYIKAPHKGT
ncbi:hypothetical protein PP427_gp201 [Salmonella phage KM16]|uniref:hypothetical protein n=1 Tax=Salmonella phage KM16 TaxID=2797303 RepID=UPI00249091A2|nr:hypothetical protein PP427_gp201 [Salmonella phage KM16]